VDRQVVDGRVVDLLDLALLNLALLVVDCPVDSADLVEDLPATAAV